VQTRAVRDGDTWVLDGQKVWTSGAQHSDYAACLARTDPDRPKRQGITMLIVDMRTAGISVRPLRQMTGDAHFNEVFLDGVRVPVENAVGDTNGGWRVARTMLAFERQALSGMGSGGGGKGGFNALVALAQARHLTSHPGVRQQLADLRIRQMVLRYLAEFEAAKRRSGTSMGGEASLLKLAMARLVQDTAEVAVGLAGMDAAAWDASDVGGGRWCAQLLSAQSASIGGGTNEIVRNVIAEQVLGLPREEEGDIVPFGQDVRRHGS
jgi:alkylation response protein AidB-like acyl-CoA dehydrogenase